MGKSNIFAFLDLPDQSPITRFILRLLVFMAILFFFLVSLQMMGGGFKLFGKETANEMINATANPFVSLFIGMLATAIIQSSSTTTSMIVGMAASGVVSLEGAVPLIMGANIGTSVTSSIVSFGHIGKKNEYKRAIAAATVHDFFNILVTLVIFPLEYFFGFLSKLSSGVASWIGPPSDEKVEVFSIMKVTVKPVAKWFEHVLDKNPWLIIIVSVVILFIMLRLLTLFLKARVIGKAEKKVKTVIFKSPFRSLMWGLGLTTAVQSSSVTTSLMVPLVAAGKVTLKRVFPFMMGANIGTTTTALIAAFGGAEAGIPIALAHLFFNLIGVVIFFPIKAFRDIPIKLARNLGKATLKNRYVGALYIGLTFFIIPFFLIFLTQSEVKISEFNYKTTIVESGETTYTKIMRDNTNNRLDVYANLEKDSLPSDKTPDFKLKVSKNEGFISFGNTFYLKKEVGLCVDNLDLEGKPYSICLIEILKNKKFKIGKEDTYTSNNCYIYKSVKKDLASVDSSYTLEYVDMDIDMVLQRETYDKNDKLIVKEEPTDLPFKD